MKKILAIGIAVGCLTACANSAPKEPVWYENTPEDKMCIIKYSTVSPEGWTVSEWYERMPDNPERLALISERNCPQFKELAMRNYDEKRKKRNDPTVDSSTSGFRLGLVVECDCDYENKMEVQN